MGIKTQFLTKIDRTDYNRNLFLEIVQKVIQLWIIYQRFTVEKAHFSIRLNVTRKITTIETSHSQYIFIFDKNNHFLFNIVIIYYFINYMEPYERVIFTVL